MADDESFVKSYFRSCIAIGSKLSSCADISGHAPKCTFISLHFTGCIALASLIMYGKQFCDIRFDLLLLKTWWIIKYIPMLDAVVSSVINFCIHRTKFQLTDKCFMCLPIDIINQLIFKVVCCLPTQITMWKQQNPAIDICTNPNNRISERASLLFKRLPQFLTPTALFLLGFIVRIWTPLGVSKR